MTDLLKTPLFSQHHNLNAKIIDFGGWALPVNYGSQIEEHIVVRNSCGVFDVSHMTVSDIVGAETIQFLSYLLANDINKAISTKGKAIYSCILNTDGGVIDDLIVYYLSDELCRIVSNAGTRNKVIDWLDKQSQAYDVKVIEQPDLALIALQGPDAIAQCCTIFDKEFDKNYSTTIKRLSRFQGSFLERNIEPNTESENNAEKPLDLLQDFVGRTGYTGEDGLEFIIHADNAEKLWNALIKADIQPCGLGARDTLRLEAGLCLYGNDLDEQHTPLESGIAWTVSLSDRDFIGKSALKDELKQTLIGLVLLDKGVLRSSQQVYLQEQHIGQITSGTFSPTIQKSIALARVGSSENLNPGDCVQIAVRNKFVNAQVVDFPFLKNSKATFSVS